MNKQYSYHYPPYHIAELISFKARPQPLLVIPCFTLPRNVCNPGDNPVLWRGEYCAWQWAEWRPPKRYAHFPNSGVPERDLICNDVMDLKMSSSWKMLVAPRFSCVFGRDMKKETDTQEAEEMPRDVGGGRDRSDAATSQGMPGTTRTWKRQEGFTPRAFRGSGVLLSLDFSLQVSRTVTE